MIEPGMYFGLGFLVASLLALVFLPLVHSRAVRLTRRRVEGSIPQNVAEVQADKDQMRAEFAIATRRLEGHVAQLKEKVTEQLAEIGKRTIALNQIKSDLEIRTGELASASARVEELRASLTQSEDNLKAKIALVDELERRSAERETTLGNLGREFSATSMASDSQRIEIIALRTQIGNLTDRLGESHAPAKAAGVEQTHVATPTRLMVSDTSHNRERLLADIASAKRIEQDLRDELISIEQRNRTSSEKLRSDLAKLEAQLETARNEQEKLQRALADAGDGKSRDERQENALIRDRISSVAAELVTLTANIEGPGSPIHAILSEAAETGKATEQTLADRIRALQQQARRAPTPTA